MSERTVAAPAIGHLLESAIYADDMDAVVSFYEDVLGLRVLDAGARLVSLDAGASTVLLIFKRGATGSGAHTPDGWIPPHDGNGPIHLAFAVSAGDLAGWEQRLDEKRITVESRVRWPGGGRSIYFRDPEGHSVELVTPGTWPTY
jgi:catechol 2,3-dioxygenase-like lactoylglutathione lyase family enzyme